jgi:hypothetical protein
MIIIYTNRCMKCSERSKWNQLRRYAKSRGISLEERRVDRKSEWLAESRVYSLDLPFIVAGNIAINFDESLEKLEEA